MTSPVTRRYGNKIRLTISKRLEGSSHSLAEPFAPATLPPAIAAIFSHKPCSTLPRPAVIGESRAHVAVVSGGPKRTSLGMFQLRVMGPFCGLGMQNSVQMISVHFCVLSV